MVVLFSFFIVIHTAWDLLRIDIYGFRAFCKYFFEQHPGYFISPLRISGSAVESLFSQFKHNAGGKLDACNHATARCAHLVKQSTAAHHSGSGYRDQSLSFMEIPLQKKKYGTMHCLYVCIDCGAFHREFLCQTNNKHHLLHLKIHCMKPLQSHSEILGTMPHIPTDSCKQQTQCCHN